MRTNSSPFWKEDLGYSAAQMVYGESIRLPGEFFVEPQNQLTPTEMLLRLQSHLSHLCPQPVWHNSKKKFFVHPELATSTHVLLRCEQRAPLTPQYSGPHKVLQRGEKSFIIEYKGQRKTVSIDRLKPAFIEAILPKEQKEAPWITLTPAENVQQPAAQQPDVQPPVVPQPAAQQPTIQPPVAPQRAVQQPPDRPAEPVNEPQPGPSCAAPQTPSARKPNPAPSAPQRKTVRIQPPPTKTQPKTTRFGRTIKLPDRYGTSSTSSLQSGGCMVAAERWRSLLPWLPEYIRVNLIRSYSKLDDKRVR